MLTPEERRFDADAPYAAALSALPGAGPATLASVLRRWSPAQVWCHVVDGQLTRPGCTDIGDGQNAFALSLPAGRSDRAQGDESWAVVAAKMDPQRWWERYASCGIEVTWPGHHKYPAALVDDPQPPGVLFWRGTIEYLQQPCVAVVGTRRATPDGRAVAFELGRDLAAAGVCVVSGLALGIDGAAHTGALRVAGQPGAVGPVGVAASGVDVPYPRRHAQLWEQVVAAGAMLSETLPGRAAEAWRFPARNRIIAGLVQMVVIVESHHKGGSLITAEAAMDRGIDVRVVPGPVHSSASAGSNQLLYDGPGPVRDAGDVLAAIGLDTSHSGARDAGGASMSSAEARAESDLEATDRAVLDAMGWRSASLAQIVERSGLSVPRAMAVLDRLEHTGWVLVQGEWWVRHSPRS